jgi:glutamine amidotransferase
VTTIGVVDYGMGNRRSVQKALERVGPRVVVTSDHGKLRGCDGLVVPGVGAFPRAMRELCRRGLAELIHSEVDDGKPLLGICLGMQVLFDGSTELQPTDGLGLIAGGVTRLDSGGLRVPHIGWSEVAFERDSPMTAGLPSAGCPFYHVHSFAPRPSDPEDVVGTTEYGERFATIVAHEMVFGVQFHPEKSSSHGLRMLANFVSVCEARRAGASGRAAART